MSSIKNTANLQNSPKTKKAPVFYYEVAVSKALKHPLIYASPQNMPRGSWVQVPLKNKTVAGVIVKLAAPPQESFRCRQIISVNTDYPHLSETRLQWLLWMAKYYQYDPGLVIHLSFPRFLHPGQKFIPPPRNDKIKTPQTLPKEPDLTQEQKKCLQEILSKKGFRVHLLHGVTGSGKTEIYFRLIKPALLRRQTALVLVPEIALTPQHINRFSERFPGQVACLHSGMTDREKRLAWHDLLYGKKSILIGARSALFCPLPRLAWIILDEEHTSHFKQEEKFKYHARDSAVVLGKHLNVPVVLSSATPSLESWWNAKQGKYHCHKLRERVFKTPLPQLNLVNMMDTEQPPSQARPWWMSEKLYQALQEVLNKKEQAALFLNRRGEAQVIFCSACGSQITCPNCDISLTQHFRDHLLCHYCNWREEKPLRCPHCRQEKLNSFGLGTEALEKQIKTLFPTARVLRADRDEISTHKQWAQCVQQMENQVVDILIGTQMIAKGLDFPSLTLVGMVAADQGLHQPDFRSSEKVFQLITQVAGRAGRRKKPGHVILQSYSPKHPVLQALIQGDYNSFAQTELKQRKKYSYPPFSKLVLVRTTGTHSPQVLEASTKIKAALKNVKGLHILGPAPAVLFRVRNKYRYHLLLKSASPEILTRANQIIGKFSSKGVQIQINRDPITLL